MLTVIVRYLMRGLGSDEATTELMAAFHRNLAECGDPVAAHRAAMREARARWAHPSFWAPFFLTGGTFAPAASPDTSHSNPAGEEHLCHALHGSAQS